MNKMFHCCLPKFLNFPNLCWENKPFLPQFLRPQMQILLPLRPQKEVIWLFLKPFPLSPHRISSWWLHSSLEPHYVWACLLLSLNLHSPRVSKTGHLYLVWNIMVYPQPTLYKCVWNDLNQNVTEKWPMSHTKHPRPGQSITKLES